jgi:hypothetical protein
MRMNKYDLLRWYQWGSEKPGYVSTWRLGEDGSVISCGQMALKELWALPKGSTVKDCPYN